MAILANISTYNIYYNKTRYPKECFYLTVATIPILKASGRKWGHCLLYLGLAVGDKCVHILNYTSVEYYTLQWWILCIRSVNNANYPPWHGQQYECYVCGWGHYIPPETVSRNVSRKIWVSIVVMGGSNRVVSPYQGHYWFRYWRGRNHASHHTEFQ